MCNCTYAGCIKGISDIGATIFLNTIGDIAAYFGIVPRVYMSNKTVQYGQITKMGNKIVPGLPWYNQRSYLSDIAHI